MKRTRKPTPLGVQIKIAMIHQNLTVHELAEMIQKSDATVCEVISGKNRSEKTRDRILEALNLSPEAAAAALEPYSEE